MLSAEQLDDEDCRRNYMAFKKWWPTMNQVIGEVAAWQAWQAAILYANGKNYIKLSSQQ